VSYPAIRIEPAADQAPLHDALRRLGSYDWVVFTSVNGVEILVRELHATGLAVDLLEARRLAAIGPATARALADLGLRPALVPEEFIAESLIAGLGDVTGRRVLLPRASGARPVLPEALRRRGAEVDELAVYRAVVADGSAAGLAELRRGVDAVTFTSPSTVRGFVALAGRAGLDPGRLPGEPAVACIGPVTAGAAEKARLAPRVIAETYTGEGLIQALIHHFRSESRP
jgi:uroporphyrinogen-III synthase